MTPHHFHIARLAATRIGAAVRVAAMTAAIVGIAGGIASCASSGSAAGSTNATDASAPQARSSRYVLVESDLRAAQADNLYDAILKLRPEFLRGEANQHGYYGTPNDAGAGPPVPAGTASMSSTSSPPPPVMIYRDNLRLGSVDDLRQIPPSVVHEVRYLTGAQAAIRFGTNNSGGAILVTTK
jgi:hypothetical protein